MDTKEVMARLYMIEKEAIQLDADLKKAGAELKEIAYGLDMGSQYDSLNVLIAMQKSKRLSENSILAYEKLRQLQDEKRSLEEELKRRV